ncbi:hypothetical protein Tco_0032725 [Tanacetum coccineum]
MKIFKDSCSEDQYVVSIKEDTAYMCLHSPKTEDHKIRYADGQPEITKEEYIRLEEEKAQKRRNVFNWETARYGKIWYDEDVLDLKSVQTEFPAIVFNDSLTLNETPSCKPTVSSPNDEIDFRISFDESDDEDYTMVFDKNLFSNKIISTSDLKTDSENDNEKVNKPLFPSLETAVSCIDNLYFFKEFENEFPAIVYNDALTSKLDLSTEPTLCPQDINKFDLKEKASLCEYDEVEQSVLKIGLQEHILRIRLKPIRHIALPPRDQRHQYLRYEGLQYTDADITYFETRLARIYRREVHRVQVFDFRGLPNLMAEGLSTRMLMEHKDAQGQGVFTSRAWRRLFYIRGPLVHKLIQEFFSTFSFGEAMTDLDTAEALQFYTRQIPDKGDLRDYWIGISYAGDLLGTTLSYTSIRDSILRLCHRLIACSIARRSQALEKVIVTDLFYLRGMDVGSVNVPYLLARYLRLFASGRKPGAMISGGQFVARLADHFGLLAKERLQGLAICKEIDDTWAWGALGPERQSDAAAGVPRAAEDAPVVDEGDQAVLALVQAPTPPPAAARTMLQRMARLDKDAHEIRGELAEQREVIGAMARDFSRLRKIRRIWVCTHQRPKTTRSNTQNPRKAIRRIQTI